MYLDFLEKLLSFRSITPDSAGSIEYISELLASYNFKNEVKVFGTEIPYTTNLYSVYGSGYPNICFVGHVDVVPVGELSCWISNPFKMTIINDKVYGRGVVDMKGAIACFLSAVFDLINHYSKMINGSIALLITSDEEGIGTHGTNAMLGYLYNKSIKPTFDLAIVGEPTSDEDIGGIIKIGRRGSINFELILIGLSGHVAYPEEVNNPITHLLFILDYLKKYSFDEGNKFFKPTNLEVTSIDTDNNVTNIIPQKVYARFNIRFNNHYTSKSLVFLVEKLIQSLCLKRQIEYELKYVVSAESFVQEPIGIVSDFINVVSDFRKKSVFLSTSGGTSDARFIKNYCPTIELGLSSKTAHKINEHSKIIDLQRLYQVYYNSLKNFLI